MKYLIAVILLISFFWEKGFTSNNFLLDSYRQMFGSTMWGAALLFLYDMAMAIIGRNSPYMIEFYSEIKKDLLVCVILTATTFTLFISIPTRYSFSSVDIAFLGLPFLVYSLVDTWESSKLEVAGNKMPRKAIWAMLAMIAIAYIFFFYLLREIVSNRFTSSQALWFQITIFFTSLYAFIGAKLIQFILKKQRLEISPVFLQLLLSMKITAGLCRPLVEGAEEWNRQVKKMKTEQRFVAQRTKNKKKKR
jgi:hypothetical protein